MEIFGDVFVCFPCWGKEETLTRSTHEVFSSRIIYITAGCQELLNAFEVLFLQCAF